MKIIELADGSQTFIDDDDYDKVSARPWHLSGRYARTGRAKDRVMLHNFLIGNAPPGHEVHHINGDSLDNRKENLAFVPYGVHQHTKRHHNGKFRGVDTFGGRIRATIFKDGIKYQLGNFNTIEEAARAYDKKAIELYGEYAVLNFTDAHTCTESHT